MADDIDFSPLSDAERRAAHEQREAKLERDEPTPPPGDVEPPEEAAERLFGHPPDGMWQYKNAKGAIHFWACRWNVVRDGKPDKEIRPLSWFLDRGWRFAQASAT
jgi:hypothetical protein